MGRYYTGDIEGKFWFGVQASDDADFFGVTGDEPSELNYYFDKDEDLQSVKEGIKTCLEKLGFFKEMFDVFFEHTNGYNDEVMKQAWGDEISCWEGVIPEMLEWYARLRLGEQIEDCLEQNGDCSFTAEC